MENNYVLLGLIILTVACIYLFYTNFQKNKEYELLATQVSKLRIQNEENRKCLATTLSSSNEPTQEQHVPDIIHENNVLNVDLDITQSEHQELDGHDNQPNMESVDNELDIQLNEDELEEINNLDDLENLNNSNNVEEVTEEFDLNDDVASVIESVLMEPVDNIEMHPDNTSNDVEVVETNESETLDDSDNELNEDNTQYLNMSNQNLETMTHKELKLMCKNLGLKTKGNKEELMQKIKEKLVEN